MGVHRVPRSFVKQQRWAEAAHPTNSFVDACRPILNKIDYGISMFTLRLRAAYAVIATLILCCTLPAQAQTATAKPARLATPLATRIEVNIQATNATPFLVTFAEMSSTDVIVDGYFAERRINLTGEYDTAAAVFKAVAEQLGASLKFEQGVFLFSHPCTPKARAHLTSNAALKKKVNLHFQSHDQPSVAITHIAGQVGEYVVQWHPESKVKRATSALEISGAMGIRFREVELKKFLELMSYMAGYAISNPIDNRIQLRELPRSSDCAKPPESLVKQVTLSPESTRQSERRKEYLEYFAIGEMRATGRVVIGGVTFVVMQLNHGTVARVQMGNYMGKNYGRVETISTEGIGVREILKDAEEEWYERNRFIRYHAPIDDNGVTPVPAVAAAQFRVDARRHLSNDEFIKAIYAATKAIELEPSNVRSYFTRASARSSMKDHIGAIADADQGLEIEKESAVWYEWRASIKHDAGETDSAIADLAQAIKIETDPARRDELKRRQADYAKQKNE